MKTREMMKLTIVSLIVVLVSSLEASSANYAHENFVQCLSNYLENSTSISKIIYTPSSPLYYSILNFSIQNLRFTSADTPKPQVIVTPLQPSHVQATLYCAKKHGLEIRVRSGGHDYEGLSFVAEAPFVILDMFNLRAVTIDVESATAWVQAGATQGELYHAIVSKSRVLAFPGGECLTVGVGGFISGGGYGMLLRKYGLGADHVIDAQFIDVNGKILNRKSMGEDLFWAIRGGGGGNFGIILAWKTKLVSVPPKVTAFNIQKSLNNYTTKLVHKWQYVAPHFPEDLFVRVLFSNTNTSQGDETTIQYSFQGLFLGEIDGLLPLMENRFPELGLVREDCYELSWIESVLYFDDLQSIDALLSREDHAGKSYFKRKSDYVREPIPIEGMQGLWKLVCEQEPGSVTIAWNPYGGRMNEISESATPYPHRAGILFFVFQGVSWNQEGIEASSKHLRWMRKLYKYMTPYVSKNPREAYVNYRDLDLGITSKNTTYEQARIWGVRYFKNNFDRLVQVKTEVDPDNFFRNQQSIPPLILEEKDQQRISPLTLDERGTIMKI